MSDGDLVLEVSREEQRTKVAVYGRGEGAETTLRLYQHQVLPWEQVEAGCREIVTLLNRANRRARVTPEILNNLKKSGQILFDLLIPAKPREKLNSTTARSLTVYIDDNLVQIPWELLFNGREFLCRRFAMGRIVRSSQAPAFLPSRALRVPLKVLILADPRGNLEASYHEGGEIKNFLDEIRETFRVDFISDPIEVLSVKKILRDYDIIHYAGHADYDLEKPADSGWLLKDGKLKASDIYAMAGLQPMPSLVFSNACQSGRTGEWKIEEGYEQEIFGLANAFLLSGAQHYLGTFWDILDEPSSHFAKRFYSFLAKGENVGEAVGRARQELIEVYGEETIVWASYMLYGDPTFEFVSASKEEPAATVGRAAAPLEWSHLTRGEALVPTPAPKASSARFLYLLLGVSVLALALVAYHVIYPSNQATKVGSHPVTMPIRSSPVETEKATEVEEKAQLEKPVIVAKVTRSQEVIKPKETMLPAQVGQEVAVKKEPAPPAVAAPLSLSMNIIGQRKEADGTYTEVLVSEGSIIRSHDNFQVHLETNRSSYIYILLYDSQGRASQLFPDSKINQPGFAEPGKKYVIPDKDLWFWLDENTGTETVYVLASEKPMEDIQELLKKMEKANEGEQKRLSQEIQQRIAVMQRGAGGITKGQVVTYHLSDGKKIQKVTEVVSGTGAMVRAISFHHR